MSGAPARRRPGPRKLKGNRINGVEVPNDAELETDERPKPTPLFPVSKRNSTCLHYRLLILCIGLHPRLS